MQSELWQRSRFGKAFLSFFLALAVAVGVGAWWGAKRGQADSAVSAIPELGSAERSEQSSALPASGTFAPLVERAAPAVVSIQSTLAVRQPQMPQGFPFFFGPQDPDDAPRRQGQGSGVIISADGYVLTNHHVVNDAEGVTVVLADEREFDAEIVGSDQKTDIALLKVEGDDLPTLPLGNSDGILVGDIVLAIGNPFGIGQTVTMGIVGATGREFGITRGGYEDFIQTDAAINPGNSGGPLINTAGEVVGINTAILSRSGGNIGVGFAVPINLAHMITKQLAENGRVVRGYMGVGIQDVNPTLSRQLQAPDAKGAVVTRVEPGGPADKAGFEQYDIIREIDGKAVTDTRELRLMVASLPPGKTADVTVLRDGEEERLQISLGEFPSDDQSFGGGNESSGVLDGVSVDELTPQLARRLGIDPATEGVVVTEVSRASKAFEAGLRSGDIVQEVNRSPVASVSEFRQRVRDAGEDGLLLLVTGRRGPHFVVIEP